MQTVRSSEELALSRNGQLNMQGRARAHHSAVLLPVTVNITRKLPAKATSCTLSEPLAAGAEKTNGSVDVRKVGDLNIRVALYLG